MMEREMISESKVVYEIDLAEFCGFKTELQHI